jgi:Tfp pilus assembly protein PilX
VHNFCSFFKVTQFWSLVLLKRRIQDNIQDDSQAVDTAASALNISADMEGAFDDAEEDTSTSLPAVSAPASAGASVTPTSTDTVVGAMAPPQHVYSSDDERILRVDNDSRPGNRT